MTCRTPASRHPRSLMRALSAGALMALGGSALLPAQASAQRAAQDLEGYLTHAQLTTALQALERSHRNLASIRSFARSDQGRDIWLLTLGNPATGELDSKPALLLVANLEGNHLVGSSAALGAARWLLERYGQDPEATRLLDERTVYILPRMNPDGAELAWTLPAYETPFKPHPSAPGRGGLNAREIGTDLNGDGFVTLMRERHPEGTWMIDPDEPRLMREANRARAERGEYRVFVEGIDTTLVNAYVPMGSDGVNLNRNFPHDYLYFQPHVGPHQVSEVETRALADFMFEQTNIAAVLTFSPYDNLRSVTPENRRPPAGVAPGPPNQPSNLQPQDRPYFQYIAEQFGTMTELRGDGAPDESGSFTQFAYFQVGIPAFTTPVWTVEPGAGTADHRWLRHFDEAELNRFVDWIPATHPQLGEVEVGGFLPNARINPPHTEVAALAEAHAEFITWLGNQTAQVELVETRVTARGEGVWEVHAVVANERYLPTQTQMGGRIRFNRPVTVRLLPTSGMTVLTGNIQQQVNRIEGMGGRAHFTWLVQAPAGTRIPLEIFAERAGGLQSTTVTLR
jgi:hypothetical protein